MNNNRLVKKVVFGEMEWKTTRGRLHKEWLEDIKEWCNKEIYELKRKAQDRDTMETNSQTCIGHKREMNTAWIDGLCIDI